MTEQQNWEIMGEVFKSDAENLRAELGNVVSAIHSLRSFFNDFISDNNDLSLYQRDGLKYLLSLAEKCGNLNPNGKTRLVKIQQY